MALETCLIFSKVSHSLLCWTKNFQSEINEKTAYIQARLFLARTLEENGKARPTEGKAAVI